MSIRKRVWRLVGNLGRRVELVEDSVERIAGAVESMLEIKTELTATAARIEAAVVEQGRTLRDALDRLHEEASIRAGIGREQMRQSAELDGHDRRLAAVERGRGGAAE